jgi:hypothetical protein
MKMTAARLLLKNEQSEEKKRKEINLMKVKTNVKAGPIVRPVEGGGNPT